MLLKRAAMTPVNIQALQQQKTKGDSRLLPRGKAGRLKTRNYALLPCSVLLLGGLLSCNASAPSGVSVFGSPNVPLTNIGDLPQKQDADSQVYLKGQVNSQAPFVGSSAYELRDQTGKIWVLTTQTLPNQGDEVIVKGKVQYRSIPLAGKELGEVYLQEQEQLERKPAQKGAPLLPEGSYEP